MKQANSLEFEAIRSMVESILTNPFDRPWTIQGFGMLRTYFNNDWRLHVWDKRYEVKDVSTMHDHPWDFNSLVIAGIVGNLRFDISAAGSRQPTHMMRTIVPGEGLQVLGDDVPVTATRHRAETWHEGDWYYQRANEVHISSPEIGTVTLVKRVRVGDDLARTFYPVGRSWVSGEPRTANLSEVQEITRKSLATWFKK